MPTLMTTDRITLERYEQLVDAGVFGDRAPFELIDGELVDKMTQNPPHTVSDEACGLELGRLVPHGWHVRCAKPIRLAPQDSKPEPDRCVVRGRVFDYAVSDPSPADVALVVEISDSLLALDQGTKLRAYATAGIPIYWIVNLMDSRIEVYTDPRPSAYRTQVNYTPGQLVCVIIDGDLVGEIAVDDILPPRPVA